MLLFLRHEFLSSCQKPSLLHCASPAFSHNFSAHDPGTGRQRDVGSFPPASLTLFNFCINLILLSLGFLSYKKGEDLIIRIKLYRIWNVCNAAHLPRISLFMQRGPRAQWVAGSRAGMCTQLCCSPAGWPGGSSCSPLPWASHLCNGNERVVVRNK